MNTFQLDCFLAVAEYLNFAQAAQALHVTHPAVSQQIKSLEKELGVRLFERTTRSVRLTEEGMAFLPDAQQIVALSRRAAKRFSAGLDTPMETLSIGCYSSACMILMADVLADLRAARPALHPLLQTIPFRHIYQWLERGDLDAVLGFREEPGTKINGRFKEFAKVPVVCVCARSHPLAKAETVCMEELKQEKLVLFMPPKGLLPVIRLQGQLMGNRPPSEFYFCQSTEAIVVLVMAGYGISVLPDFLVPDDPMLSKIPLKDIDPMSFGIYYQTLQGKPGLKALIQCAREFFESAAPAAATEIPGTHPRAD